MKLRLIIASISDKTEEKVSRSPSPVSHSDLTNDPLHAELSSLTKQQLIDELKTLKLDYSCKKAELLKRLEKYNSELKATAAASLKNADGPLANSGNMSELGLIFEMFQKQQMLQEKRHQEQQLQQEDLNYKCNCLKIFRKGILILMTGLKLFSRIRP